MIPIKAIIFSSIFFCIYGIGLLNFLSDFEKDKCEMTFMFEYPQFVRISNKIDEQLPKYGLYAYSEGRRTAKVRSMYFTGIPVLFIPGNGGSYKQVRSLASVALRKALSSRSPFSFDYFTIDLNNELSGLYGPLLYDQLKYVNSSLNRILELYKKENEPSSVIVIGHSMGGIIARKLISEIEPGLVSILVTLAAPLRRPAVIFDYHLNRFYEYNRTDEYNKTAVVSLSGGYSDFLVPPYLGDVNEPNSLFVVTTNIPRSWVEANHVEIVWCKQTVLVINRALFDSIDVRTKQVSTNVTYLNKVFEHHFVRNSGIKLHNLEDYNEAIPINYKGDWIESVLTQYSIEFLHGLKEARWYMVKLNTLPSHEVLTVLGINIETVDWVFACNAYFPRGGSRVCPEAMHLTHLSEIVPSVKYKRRYLQINMHELKKNNTELTHIVVRALPTKEPLVFHVDVHNLSQRRISIDVPSWWHLKKTVILEETSKKAVHYELEVKGLQHVLQFHHLFVEPLKCEANDHHASATLVVPWGNQNSHAYFTNVDKKPLNLRVYTSKPPSESSSAIVRLILDPSCTYQLSIKSSFFGYLGQLARITAPLLLTNIAVIVLLALKFQLKSLKSGHCPMLLAAIKEGAKPYFILPFSKLLMAITTRIDFLPKPDSFYFTEDGTEFFALPILLFLFSIVITMMLSIVYCISLVTLDSTVSKLSLKLSRIFFTISWSDYFITSVLEKAPLIAAAVLVLTSFSTCGAIALCLGVFLYFLKLTHMSQDYIEKIVWFAFRKFIKVCRNFLRRQPKEAKDDSAKQIDGDMNKDETQVKESTDETVKSLDEGGDISENKVNDLKERLEKCDIETLKNKETEFEELKSETEDIPDKHIEDNEKEPTLEGSEAHNEKHEFEIRRRTKKESGDEMKTTESDANTPQNVKTLDENDLTDAYNSIFFHSTLFFIWCIVALINLPAALTWAHNFKFRKTLVPDDSFIPGIVLSICALPLWQFDFPKAGKKWTTPLEIFVVFIAVVSFTFASVSVYRLNYLLTLIIVVITLHQLFAPESETKEENQGDHVESKEEYDKVKLKLN